MFIVNLKGHYYTEVKQGRIVTAFSSTIHKHKRESKKKKKNIKAITFLHGQSALWQWLKKIKNENFTRQYELLTLRFYNLHQKHISDKDCKTEGPITHFASWIFFFFFSFVHAFPWHFLYGNVVCSTILYMVFCFSVLERIN